jgi:hypothetical protein
MSSSNTSSCVRQHPISGESRRARIFGILLVTIFGAMWWMATARATIERATAEAVEYGRPLPASLAVIGGGDDALVGYDAEGPRHRDPATFFADGEDWTGVHEAL